MPKNTPSSHDLADDIFSRYIAIILALFLTAGSGFVLWNSFQNAKEINEASAVEEAQRLATSIAEFRNFYSTKIVPEARDAGVTITHNYTNQPNALPLPATFAKDFGDFINSGNTDFEVRLYSDKPFPWRTNTDLDEFEVWALKQLTETKQDAVWRFEKKNGQSVIRFARADPLGESCVGCHNNYPGTPKTDWKVGDLRGILEITSPIQALESAAIGSFKQSLIIMLGVIVGMISLLILVLKRMRKALKLAHEALVETSRSDQLKAEEIERRKAVAQTLKVTDAKMRAIVNSVQDVIIAIDQHGIITDINESSLAVFGHAPNELMGKNIRVLVGDEHRDKHDGYLENYIKTGEAHVIGKRRELFAIKKDGTSFPIELAVNVARVDSQIIFTGIIRDITHRRKNEEQIAKAHKAAIESANLKSEFLANMSHEIRTPMNGVIGMTEMLLDSGLTPEQRNLTRTVHESAESLLVIINDILDFSKIEAGKLTIKPHPFRLVHTLEAVMDLLAEEASRKQINLALFIDADVPQELVSDAGRLRQVLINLLGNALKFTEQGYVLLHLSRLANGDIHFDVKDSGSGIPEDAQATLFDAFSQVDGSSTREHGGTGLGLAICNQLVSLLGGELSVNSTLGEGSCFSFAIPGGPIDKDAQPFIQANQMSVLMYSTDLTLNRYHEHQMREWNIQPKIVTTLNQCFSQIEAQDYQMIAIDADNLYYDPEHALGALSLVRSIRQTTDTQIVLYGSIQSFMSLEMVKLGDNVKLIQKPIKHSEIQLMVDQEQFTAQKAALLKPQAAPVLPKPEVTPLPTEATASPIMFNLLLAEDNSVNQMVATTMLKKLGYQVDVVNNGREALDAIKEKQYDLIFMDCQMPVLDGYAATGEIRRLGSELSKIPIIALTAHAMMSNDQKCFDAGMDDYLAKPVRINELKAALLKWQPKMLERREFREAQTPCDG